MKSQKSKIRHAGFRVSAVGIVAVLLAGCASAAVPNAEFADTQGAASAAEASGAQDTPEASLYLKMSTDGLELAEQQMANGENKEALLTLEQAKADARLAISLTSNAQVEEQAIAAFEHIEKLRAEGGIAN